MSDGLYSAGTISVSAGATAVTGSGTAWSSFGIRAGDVLVCNGLTVPILTVNTDTSITLAHAWPGSTVSGGSYDILVIDEVTRAFIAANTLINELQNGIFAGLIPDTLTFQADQDTGLSRTGSNALALIAGGVSQLALSAGVASGAAVQSSATDATAGKLLKVGAGGLLTGLGLDSTGDYKDGSFNGFLGNSSVASVPANPPDGNHRYCGFASQVGVHSGLVILGNGDAASPKIHGAVKGQDGAWGSWSTFWTSESDGAGSGLDADLLDGQHGAYYLPAASFTGAQILSRLVSVDGAGSGLDADRLDGLNSTDFFRINQNNFSTEGIRLVSSSYTPSTDSVVGISLRTNGQIQASSGINPLSLNKMDGDGWLTSFQKDGTTQGTISVAGTTVSYNGGHLSRWSRLLPDDPTDLSQIRKGTVLSNLDQMIVWRRARFTAENETILAPYFGQAADGAEVEIEHDGATYTAVIETEDNEQLNHVKISSVAGDRDVAGVFVGLEPDDGYNDFRLAMTGDMVILIGAGTAVARGDLLESAGDGTARPQADDLVRSSTIAKVTSSLPVETFADGTYTVPCVLMAC